MSRSSVGIILPGNPECVQKKTIWMRIVGFICKYGFAIAFIAGAIFFVLMFVERSIHFSTPYRLFGVGILLLLAGHIWGETCRCEYCRHFFTLKRISSDKVVDKSTHSISRNVDDYDSGMAYDWSGNVTFFNVKSSHKEYGTEEKETFTYNMRCSCCGSVQKIRGYRSKKSF